MPGAKVVCCSSVDPWGWGAGCRERIKQKFTLGAGPRVKPTLVWQKPTDWLPMTTLGCAIPIPRPLSNHALTVG